MPDIGDIIELITDLPKRHLRAGNQGTIVHCHGDDAYEIEFTDEEGATTDLIALSSERFIVVWRAETGQWLSASELAADLIAKLPENAAREVLSYARYLSARSQKPVHYDIPA